MSLVSDRGPGAYYDRPLGCAADAALSALVDAFAGATAEERTKMIVAVPNAFAGNFMSYAIRMATVGVRERSRQHVLRGILAMAIEDFRSDWRENLMTLAPLNDAAARIGEDPVQLFDDAATLASPATAGHLRAFARRHPDLKALKAMGWAAVDGPSGFMYSFHWPKA